MPTISINTSEVQALQLRARQGNLAQDAAMVGARAIANLTREHLFELEGSHPNALGGPRTHFYANAARSVQNPVAGDGQVSMSINALGLAQRWLGGDTKAGVGTSSFTGKLTHYLAIPARAEAYGRTPVEFSDLHFVPRRNGQAMLVQAFQTLVTHVKNGFKAAGEVGGLVMFWLATEVHQNPDPSVMPTEEAMANSAQSAMNSFLARRLAAQ
jgi:hypothetical protein